MARLQGNWIMIRPEFGSNNIIVQYQDLVEVPPLPTLISIESHNLSVDRHDKEIQADKARLVWYSRLAIVMNQNQYKPPFATNKMAYNFTVHMPIYDVDENLKRHWFICERIWEAVDTTGEAKQVAQFVAALRKRALMWYMNFIENHN